VPRPVRQRSAAELPSEPSNPGPPIAEATTDQAPQNKARDLGPRIGEAAPEIEGEDLEGKPFKLSDYRGKVVLLQFWPSWCPLCRSLRGHERSVVTGYHDKPFVILGVNIGSQDEAADASEDRAIGTRSWRDATCVGGYATERYGIRVQSAESGIDYDFPREYLIDAKGVIRFRYSHAEHQFLHPSDLQSAIERLLAETP
jgi:peroxiredoxin